jgi:RNA polymerase sigma-70 factor (ECF subfamily)
MWNRVPQRSQVAKTHAVPHREHVYPATSASSDWRDLHRGQVTDGIRPFTIPAGFRHPCQPVGRFVRRRIVERALVSRELPSVDETAIREFLMGPYPRVVAAVALIERSRATAEDAVAEALARAWERSERGERIDSLPAWVTRVALNLSKSRLRRARAEGRARERSGARHEDDRDERLDVERALAALPRRQRQATVLRYYLGYDVAEIARVLGVSEGTIKTTLHRARHTMASALGEEE